MTKPQEQNGHEEPDQTRDDAVDSVKPTASATAADAVNPSAVAESADSHIATEDEPAEAGQPQESESEESASAQRLRRFPLILVAVALVLVLAAGIYMLWAEHSGVGQSAQKPSSGASTAQVGQAPSGDATAYKDLQEVAVKPSVADDQGGLTVSAKGVGSKKKVADAPTLEIFMDPMCPWCGKVGRVIDPQLQRMISAGQINVTYNFLNFLDSASSDEYSSRVDNALAMVAQEDRIICRPSPLPFLPPTSSLMKAPIRPSPTRAWPTRPWELECPGPWQTVSPRAPTGHGWTRSTTTPSPGRMPRTPRASSQHPPS